MSPDLIELLENHNWPGNIRELKNIVERLLTLSGKSKTIESKHLPLEFIQADYIELYAGDHNGGKKLRDAVASLEEEMTRKVLRSVKWNKTAAARELGISRTSLSRRIEKFNIRKKAT